MWVRFGAVTGRHRGQPKDQAAEDEVNERASRGRGVAVIAGAFAVPVLVASMIAVGMRDEPVQERPETAGTPVQNVAAYHAGERADVREVRAAGVGAAGGDEDA